MILKGKKTDENDMILTSLPCVCVQYNDEWLGFKFTIIGYITIRCQQKMHAAIFFSATWNGIVSFMPSS